MPERCLVLPGVRPSARLPLGILLPVTGFRDREGDPLGQGQGEPHKRSSSFTQGAVQMSSRCPCALS